MTWRLIGLREVKALPHYLDKRLIDGGKVVNTQTARLSHETFFLIIKVG
jgi:hypothetical protein